MEESLVNLSKKEDNPLSVSETKTLLITSKENSEPRIKSESVSSFAYIKETDQPSSSIKEDSLVNPDAFERKLLNIW